MLEQAACGSFPPVDGNVVVLAPDRPGHLAIVEFTGHAVVLADVDVAELTQLGADGFGGASEPKVKLALAEPGGEIGSHDAVLVARGRGRGTSLLDETREFDDHPRVMRAHAHRTSVRAYRGAYGLVTIGCGLVGRTEISVELAEDATPNQQAGRELITAGLELVAPDEFVWAQVAPGNAASLRAFLAAGFVPIGAETLIMR